MKFIHYSVMFLGLVTSSNIHAMPREEDSIKIHICQKENEDNENSKVVTISLDLTQHSNYLNSIIKTTPESMLHTSLINVTGISKETFELLKVCLAFIHNEAFDSLTESLEQLLLVDYMFAVGGEIEYANHANLLIASHTFGIAILKKECIRILFETLDDELFSTTPKILDNYKTVSIGRVDNSEEFINIENWLSSLKKTQEDQSSTLNQVTIAQLYYLHIIMKNAQENKTFQLNESHIFNEIHQNLPEAIKTIISDHVLMA